jgi:aldose 1-epimerase
MKKEIPSSQKTRVVLAEYGALLVSVGTADREGEVGHVTLSYRSLEEALAGGVFGSVIGRFANRIGGGGFEIDGKRHELESVNKDGVHIHGGATGFHRQLWKGEATGAGVVFSLSSPDGHEGYPGKVEVSVTYTLTNDNILRLDYAGTTDRPTHLNLTNHVYFNLAGSGDIREHVLEMDCEQVLAIDPRKVPTGAFLDVAETPFDFREAKPVGREIESVEGGGYDHCFVVPRRDAALVPFATLADPVSGRTMEIATTKPGVQIFTANSFKGEPFPRWGAICFETQFFPDTPNRPEFPPSLLRPGEVYRHTTEFRFGVEK